MVPGFRADGRTRPLFSATKVQSWPDISSRGFFLAQTLQVMRTQRFVPPPVGRYNHKRGFIKAF